MGRRKSSVGLKRVLALLQDADKFPGYVCRLLQLLGYEKTAVSRDIAGLDTPGCSVKLWLVNHCTEAEVFLRCADPHTVHETMKQYRIDWVKSMIEIYSAKGDEAQLFTPFRRLPC